MNYLNIPRSHISQSLKILKIHEKLYLGGVDGGVILLDHFVSLKHGLKFLGIFLSISKNEDLIQRIKYLVSYVKKKLYLVSYLGKEENLVLNSNNTYADLREKMKNVIMKPETNEYDVIFPGIINEVFILCETSLFLCRKIKKLETIDCKADHITTMMKELEDIWMLASHLKPFSEYAKGISRRFTVKDKNVSILATISSVLDRAACFIYLLFVGKMDYEMIVSLKNSSTDLIIEETQIMKMYLILDFGNLKSNVYMSIRLLKWNKKCYFGTEMGAILEDNFMSIKNGLQFLYEIHEISTNKDLKLHIQRFIENVKKRLCSLLHNQEDECRKYIFGYSIELL